MWLTKLWLSLDVNISQVNEGSFTLDILREPLIFSSLASGYNKVELQKWAKRFIHT